MNSEERKIKQREWSRKWRERHPKEYEESRNKWRANPVNHAKEIARMREYNLRPERKENNRLWKIRNHERLYRMSRKLYMIRKVAVLTHYSNTPYPKCVRCSETDVRVLTIDHINGGGWRERQANGTRVYDRLFKAGFPSGYQTLCMNDQLRKKTENRESPWRQMN